jgi:polyisoprenoid-binding protein YceI
MRRLALAALLALGLTADTQAGPVAYQMDAANSTVAFETDFGPDKITGSIPLERVDLQIDFANIRNCSVDVALDVTGATASFPFAAQALKGPKVLDAAAHPRMTFVSTSVRRVGDAADITGEITIRGVTKIVTLRAQLFRPNGSDATDLNHLTVKLSGRVNRSDFGATGWSDMVGDEVRILITAQIDAAS